MCTENKREENNNRSLYCASRTPELEMVIKENQEFKVIFNNIMNSKPCPTPIHTHTKTQKQKKPCPLSKQIHVVIVELQLWNSFLCGL